MPNPKISPQRGSVLWKRVFPQDYLPGVHSRFSRMSEQKRLQTLVKWGFVYRHGGNYYPTPNGKIRIIFSQGSNASWDALNVTEKRKWCSRMINIIIQKINEEIPGARISIRDVTARKRAKNFSVSVQERLEHIEDAVASLLAELSNAQRRTTTETGKRALFEYERRVRNFDSIVSGISEMIENGNASNERVD